MTTEQVDDLSPRELAFIKLIDIQAKQIVQYEIQIEMMRYNRRFANKKYKVPPRPSVYIPPLKVAHIDIDKAKAFHEKERGKK